MSALETLVRGLKAYEERTQELLRASKEIDAKITSTQSDVLFITIGRALTVWARMEEFLVFVVAYTLLISPSNAGLIMYSIINFNVWLSIIHDLMKDNETYAPMLPRWNKISERIRRIKDRRDQLAHHSVKLADAQLVPSKFDVRAKTKSLRPLDYWEVTEFTETVMAICNDLDSFILDMRKLLPASDNKLVEPLPDRSAGSDSQ